MLDKLLLNFFAGTLEEYDYNKKKGATLTCTCDIFGIESTCEFHSFKCFNISLFHDDVLRPIGWVTCPSFRDNSAISFSLFLRRYYLKSEMFNGFSSDKDLAQPDTLVHHQFFGQSSA